MLAVTYCRRTAAGTKFTFHRNEAFEGEVPASSGNDPASSGNDPASSGNALASSGNDPASSGNDPLSSGNDPMSSGNDLSDVEKQACALMAERGEVRSPEVAAATGLTQRGAQKLLARLVARGLAVAEGAKRNRTYRLKHNTEFR